MYRTTKLSFYCQIYQHVHMYLITQFTMASATNKAMLKQRVNGLMGAHKQVSQQMMLLDNLLEADNDKLRIAQAQTELQHAIRSLQSRLNVYLETVQQLSKTDQEVATNINKDVLAKVHSTLEKAKRIVSHAESANHEPSRLEGAEPEMQVTNV
eukprot:m.63898 g.63898  ORF g.63898 m.63898 type:complete len:154 (+) comp13982_c1_seq4:2708-3169(+)